VEKFKSLEEELGFNLIAINTKPMLREARKVIREKGATFTVLLDDSRFCKNALYVVATPTTIVVDENGRIRCRFIGTVGDFDKVLRPILESI